LLHKPEITPPSNSNQSYYAAFRFPQIETEASFSIDVQRTLRIPDSDNCLGT